MKKLLKLFLAFTGQLSELFKRDMKNDTELMKNADIIYRIMEMIYNNRGKDKLNQKELEPWFANQIYPMTDYIEAGVKNKWLRRVTDDGVEITPYGKEWEKSYWASFR